MKRQALTLVGVLSLLLAAGSAFAQTIRVQANIPFSFSVNKETLPPGLYEIQSVGSSDGKTLMIRDGNLHVKALALANGIQSLESSKQTKLIFNRRGSRYFLSQVWVEGNDSGHELPVSPREAEMAKDYAAEPVMILARLR
jgi:hypothetical protein